MCKDSDSLQTKKKQDGHCAISYHLRVSSSNPDKSRSKYVRSLAFFQECKERKVKKKCILIHTWPERILRSKSNK